MLWNESDRTADRILDSGIILPFTPERKLRVNEKWMGLLFFWERGGRKKSIMVCLEMNAISPTRRTPNLIIDRSDYLALILSAINWILLLNVTEKWFRSVFLMTPNDELLIGSLRCVSCMHCLFSIRNEKMKPTDDAVLRPLCCRHNIPWSASKIELCRGAKGPCFNKRQGRKGWTVKSVFLSTVLSNENRPYRQCKQTLYPSISLLPLQLPIQLIWPCIRSLLKLGRDLLSWIPWFWVSLNSLAYPWR